MPNPILALIVPLGDGGLGFWGGTAPPYPDQGLPGAPPGYWGGVAPPQPSHPIYHPGHPDHGKPSHPIAQPPGSIHHPIYNPAYPSHPIHIPGVPDQGLPQPEPIPPEEVTPPELPAGHEDDLIIAVRSPGGEWQYSAYDVQPDQGQPQPTPQGRGSRTG
jgi:hypothetical protein